MEEKNRGNNTDRKMEAALVSPEMYLDFIKSKPVAVIHFWASWNRYDDEMKARLNQIDATFSDQIAVGYVDIDQEQMWELAKELKVLNLPALAYYKNGEHIETTIGLSTKEQIEANLKNLLIRA